MSQLDDALSTMSKNLNDSFSVLMQACHLASIVTAKIALTEASQLSAIVPETSRTTVTAYDKDGRILSTKTTKTPRHPRNFDAVIKKQMEKLRSEMGERASNPAVIYFDAFAHVWRKDAVKRAKILAKNVSFADWLIQTDEWNAKRRTPRAETTLQYINRRCTNLAAKQIAAGKAKREAQEQAAA